MADAINNMRLAGCPIGSAGSYEGSGCYIQIQEISRERKLMLSYSAVGVPKVS
jgi:hypothetical protein